MRVGQLEPQNKNALPVPLLRQVSPELFFGVFFQGAFFWRLLSGFGLPLGAKGRPKRAFWVPKGVQKVTKIVLFAKPGKVDLEW